MLKTMFNPPNVSGKKLIVLFILLVITTSAFAQPSWQWATKAGGSDYDIGYGITIDDAGNTYVTGLFKGTATFGSYSLTSDGNKDIFVAKMDANGNWQWATKAGGSEVDIGYGITIDAAGNTYVTGFFRETATFGSYSLTSDGDEDIFVARMDANGNWQWATKAGGNYMDIGEGITIDDDGNTYVTGFFEGTATFGFYSITGDGSYDIFVAKMDTNGNWQWATKAGGSSWDRGYEITIDDDRNTYVTGYFTYTATFGSYFITGHGITDIFVAKMDSNGKWQWVTKAGGSDWDRGHGITIDDDRNTYVTGHFEGTATFDSYSLTSYGNTDIFVAKMDANGNWQWATKAGGSDWDTGYGVTIDDAGNTYVTGYFKGTATFDSYSLTSDGLYDIFVAKLGISHGVNDDFTERNNFIKQNSPNPFDINTSISYFIPHNCKVEIQIYNIKGELVKTIVDEYKQSGEYIVDFNGSELSSGIYFYKMDVDGINKAVKKMVVLR